MTNHSASGRNVGLLTAGWASTYIFCWEQTVWSIYKIPYIAYLEYIILCRQYKAAHSEWQGILICAELTPTHILRSVGVTRDLRPLSNDQHKCILTVSLPPEKFNQLSRLRITRKNYTKWNEEFIYMIVGYSAKASEEVSLHFNTAWYKLWWHSVCMNFPHPHARWVWLIMQTRL